MFKLKKYQTMASHGNDIEQNAKNVFGEGELKLYEGMLSVFLKPDHSDGKVFFKSKIPVKKKYELIQVTEVSRIDAEALKRTAT